MGLDIWIMKGRNYNEDKLNHIYHATYNATESFGEQCTAFRILTNFAYDGRDYPAKVTPEEYSRLIPQFEIKKAELEKEGKIQRGKDIDSNAITLYDCVADCLGGLKRAQKLGKSIKLS
jgi:hypothetical protein